MSQRDAFLHGCKGKRQYHRRRFALRAMRQMQTSGRGGDHSLAPYRCDFCGFYHLGHDPHRKQRQ